MIETVELSDLKDRYSNRFRGGGRVTGKAPCIAISPEQSGERPMEARVTKLQTHVEYIRRDLDAVQVDVREHRKESKADFRILFSALISTALGLAALMAKGFGWV